MIARPATVSARLLGRHCRFHLRPKLCSTAKPTDRELHELYEGLIPRVASLTSLFSTQGKKKFVDLIDCNVVTPAHFLMGLPLYADLQHPLLIKYGFDPKDFLEGSIEAYRQIQLAIASKDFEEYAQRMPSTATATVAAGVEQDPLSSSSSSVTQKAEERPPDSPSATLLQQATSSAIYEACLATSKDLKQLGLNIYMTDIKVTRAQLTSIRTRIHEKTTAQTVDESLLRDLTDSLESNKVAASIVKPVNESSPSTLTTPSGTTTTTGEAASPSVSSGENNTTHSTSSSHSNSNANTDYPAGSVIADVLVFFEAIEEYHMSKLEERSSVSKSAPFALLDTVFSQQIKPKKITRRGTSRFVFSGCISGHTALDWVVTRI